MGRASFGGGSDYSGLFQNLYQNVYGENGTSGDSLAAQAANLRYQFESKQLNAQQYADALRALAATGDQTSTNHFNLLTTAENALQSAQAEADAKKKNEQAAADQNAADAWSNGLMSDDEWLSYLGQRAATEEDPKEKAKWQGYQQKYSLEIADSRAEGAFANGGSINDLILHYQGKLGSVQRDSQEYRETQERLNNLQDQRSSTAIQDGAEKISARIQRGQATYQDLVKFYKAQVKGLRPGSDMAKQLQDEIVKVEGTIFQNAQAGKLEKLQYDYERGAITGRAFAQGIRSVATQFKDTDPQKYYQLLESAVKLDKEPGFIGAAGRARSAAAASKKAKTAALNAQVDQFQAQRNVLLSLIKQYDSGSKTGFDSSTGRTITFTPQIVKELDRQILDTYEALAEAHEAKGDHSAAQGDWAARSKYIVQGGDGVRGITGHNTDVASAHYNDLLLGSVKALQMNVESGKPSMAVIQRVASDWERYAASLTRTPAQGTAAAFFPNGTPKNQLSQVDPEFASKVNAIRESLRITANPNATPEQRLSAAQALAGAFGADPNFPESANTKQFNLIAANLLDPADRASSIVAGLADGSVTRLVQDGKLTYVNTRIVNAGEAAVAPELEPDVELETGSGGKPLQKFVKVVVDIDGTPTVVNAVANLRGSSLGAWVATKDMADLGIAAGDRLTADQMAQLDEAFPGWQRNRAKLAPAYDFYEVQTPTWTDKYGRSHQAETWLQDDETGQWYRGKYPLRGVNYNADGSVRFVRGADGQATIDGDYRSFADAAGVPAPYAGSNPDKVGALIGLPGGIDVTGLRGRDINGFVTDQLSYDPAFAYWDPESDKYRPPVHDDWYNDDYREQRLEAARVRAAQALGSNINAQTGFTLPTANVNAQTGFTLPSARSIADSVVDFAKSIGLNFGSGGLNPSTGFRAPTPAAPAGPNVNAQTGFVLPPTPTSPRVSAQTGFTLPQVSMPTPSFSGPTLNLPPLVTPRVTAPVIRTPVVNAQTGFTIPQTPAPAPAPKTTVQAGSTTVRVSRPTGAGPQEY